MRKASLLGLALAASFLPTAVGGMQSFAIKNYGDRPSSTSNSADRAYGVVKSRKQKCSVKQGQRAAAKRRNIQRNKAHH